MHRIVEAELLDELPADDPRAVHARRDLQKINRLMGNARILSAALRRPLRECDSGLGTRDSDGTDRIPNPKSRIPVSTPLTIVELGAGDGALLLQVANRLERDRKDGTGGLFRADAPKKAPGTVFPHALLVDRRPSLSPQHRAGFDRLGWKVETIEADVFEWLQRRNPQTADVTIANLFLHHFGEPELASLLCHASHQTRRFLACEPVRARAALAGAAMLRFIGCNSVTLHDARISVRAGFRDAELSKLWPRDSGWRLTERRTGPFTHVFLAEHHETSQPAPC